jgi:hypothetical protein
VDLDSHRGERLDRSALNEVLEASRQDATTPPATAESQTKSRCVLLTDPESTEGFRGG